MTILRGRYHDVENKIVVTSSGLLLIDDALKVAKEKNQPIDIERLKSLINASIANLQEVEKGLGFVKKIAYKACDRNVDYDNLIFLDDNKRILITDNDVNAIEDLKAFFLSTEETRNAKMFFATSVNESLDIIKNHNPSLAFLDLALDNAPVSCLNILRFYKDKTKMVILSKNDEYKQECLDDGALTYILKPLQKDIYVKVMVDHA